MSSQVAYREKYWEELSAEEKIEKLGYLVENLNASLINLREKYSDYDEHDHINGKIVIPLNRNSLLKSYGHQNILSKNPKIDLKKEDI